MTHQLLIHLSILPVLSLNDQPLFAPVLQHLLHAVLSDASPLHSDGVLHGLLEGKLLIKSFKDRVVLTFPQSLTA